MERWMSGKPVRALGWVAAVLVITAALMKAFGSVWFTPAMTDVLVRAAGRFGLHGVEEVEDFYMVVTTIISLVIAATAVRLAVRLRRRRVQPL